jgi:hypothetical protein
MTFGPPCPYRAVGYTWQAGLYPLSDNGLAIIAEHNGTTPDELPRGARCSSGPGMHGWMEALGARKSAGLPYRNQNGRFLLPAELAA